jgi:SNF2 family DNA or RNA helicase
MSTINPNDPSLQAKIFASGFTAALHRRLGVAVQSTPCAFSLPDVVSVRVAGSSLRVESFAFAPTEQTGWGADDPFRQTEPTIASKRRIRPGGKSRRIRPPTDTVKLQDRLFYLLQPPLESWLNTENFQFPFEPFPFQLDGLAFLYPRHAAVLGDEMGLGKTMQAITTMRMLLRAGEIKSVLVICPKPLVTNWSREISVWAPEIPCAVIGGNRNRRQFQWQQREVPIQIANYELLVRDQPCIDQIQEPFDLVILDEAQRIKNAQSATSQVARSIRRQRSWALTGTPIENSAEDLVGIFEFVRPGHLSSAMSPRRLGKAAADFILRRTKEEVLKDLPPKLFRDAEIQLTQNQWNSYDLAQSKGVVKLNELGDALTIQHVFELVLRLKQICNFDPATGDSAKLMRLEADLEEVAESGQKAIIFSQWVKTLNTLQDRLQRFNPLAYHGQIKQRHRDAVLDEFKTNDKRHVLLMSYGAGSVGLNLQYCGYVFLFDRWWNPAVEDQAINRAHRIGSQRPVTVTRFLASGTIEERIDAVLEAKRELLQMVLSAAGGEKSLGLSRREIFGLFDLPRPQRPNAPDSHRAA